MKKEKESIKKNYYWVNILNDEYWVGVWIGQDYTAISKFLQKHFQEIHNSEFDPETFKELRGKAWEKNGYVPVIYVNTKYCDETHKLYATLAHEAIHAVNGIFSSIGQKNDSNNDEVFAHSVRAIVSGINKLNKKGIITYANRNKNRI